MFNWISQIQIRSMEKIQYGRPDLQLSSFDSKNRFKIWSFKSEDIPYLEQLHSLYAVIDFCPLQPDLYASLQTQQHIQPDTGEHMLVQK